MPMPDCVLEQRERELQAEAADVEAMYAICNAALRCKIECPDPASSCIGCGNEACIKAKEDLDKLWQSKDGKR